MMMRSLFMPLFGMSGFLSRINGLIIRGLAIVLSSLIILAYLILGVIGYISIYFLLFHLLTTKIVYFLIFIGFVFLCGIYNYYFHNSIHINGQEIQTGLMVEALYSSAIKGNPNPLHSSIEKSSEIRELLIRAEIPFEDTMKFIESNLKDFDSSRFNSRMSEFVDKGVFSDNRLKISDLFSAYLLQFTLVSAHLDRYRFDDSQLIQTLSFLHNLKTRDPRIWDSGFQIPPSGGIDKGWAVAYTPHINRVGTDLTKLALRGQLPKLIGRRDVEDSIISVLSKSSSNNVLLTGVAGSGKTTFIKAIAREIALGTSIPALKYKRIISIDVGSLTSGKSADVTKITSQIAKEAEISGNVILFVDEIHNLATLSSNDPNASAVFAVLEPYLSSAKFQFIGTTSYDNYLKYIKPNDSFARTFDVIELRETTDEETMAIMQDYVKNIEPKQKVKYSYPALKTILDSGKRYVHDRALPDKALSLLTQVYKTDKDSDHVISREDVLDLISERFHISAKTIGADEKQILLNIESLMKQKIIGQDQAVSLITKALKRARAGIRNENKPIASFLFAGPTGVGKTETAKVLAETYFGNKDSMIRVDMSEYQTPDSVSRLIGDSNGNVGYLISKIQESPNTIILLDEIEKADKNVLNLFLQVLDDGRLTSSSGKTYDFTESFIIMTTNIGTKSITKSLVENNSIDNLSDLVLGELKDYFPIEFLNRFTALIPYSSLSKEDVSRITRIKLDVLKKKIKEKKISIEFSDNAVNQIAEMAYSPEWGARELNRLIEDKVETLVAEKIISGEINSGDTYKFDMIQ